MEGLATRLSITEDAINRRSTDAQNFQFDLVPTPLRTCPAEFPCASETELIQSHTNIPQIDGNSTPLETNILDEGTCTNTKIMPDDEKSNDSIRSQVHEEPTNNMSVLHPDLPSYRPKTDDLIYELKYLLSLMENYVGFVL